MPDNIERTIYKLELDGSSYINGVDKLSASTAKLTQEQERANKALQDNQDALKSASDFLQKSKKDLDDYTGTNEKYRQQLTKTFVGAQNDQSKLIAVVEQSRKSYDAATAAAQNFANIASKAANIAQGGQIAPPLAAPPVTIGPALTNQIASVLNVPEFVNQAKIVDQTKKEFDDLRTSISLAEARMKQLNATDEEFKQLAPIVAQGKEALHQYDVVTGNVVEKTTRLRTEIFNTTDELTKMREAGKENTQQYQDLQDHVANLTKEYREQRSIIKILSSETRAIDFGKAAIQTAISGFQAYTAISILAGNQSEELQKKTMQLFAAMQLLASLEQLVTSLKKGSIIATNLQSAAQTVYTAVVGASTAALSAFKIALASAGIGAAILAVGYLVSKFIELKEAEQKATEQQRTLIEINKKAAESYADEVVHLKLLTAEYDNVNTSAKRKNEIIKELQDTYPNYFKDLDTHADKEKYIAEQVEKVSKALILQAEIRGAEDLLAKKFQDVLKKEFDPESTIGFLDRLGASFRHLTDAAAKIDVGKQAAVNVNNAEYEYEQFGDFIQKFVLNANKQLSELGGDPHAKADTTKTAKAKKEIQDDFEARKAAILEELAKLAASEFEGDVAIRKQYAEKLKKAILDINKDKGLKPGERKELITLTTQLNTAELDKALKDYNQKQIDARTKLNDELRNLENKNIQDQLNLIRDEFNRRSRLIDFNERKELDDEKAAQEKRMGDLNKNAVLLFGVDYKTNQDYLEAKARLNEIGERKITDIILQAHQARQKLAVDEFEHLIDETKKKLESTDVGVSAGSLIDIRKQTDLFLKGTISYDTYQKNLTKIAERESNKRYEDEAANLQKRITAQSSELLRPGLTDEQRQKILDEERGLQKELDDLEANHLKNTADIVKKGRDAKIDEIVQFAQAIGEVAQSVISFWQLTNEAEQKQLEFSISLQERRVAAAQRIAARGNASYLKQEEDRLTQLNIRQANAAKRQIGINAAIQASEALVAVVSGIAQGVKEGGVLGTVIGLGAVLAAIATGFAVVQSLKPPVPTFAKGTKYAERDGHPSGRDTIPAMIDEGEAIIPTHRNKAYHPTVEAIYDGTVPAEHLNNFVQNYHKVKSVPRPNYERIKEAGELKIGQDGKMSVLLSEHSSLLKENNELQRAILKKKGVHAELNVDKTGVGMMVTEFQEQIKRNKRI